MIKKQFLNSARYLVCLILLFLAGASGCRKSKPVETESSSQERYNLVYGSDSLQKYDLFIPAGHDQQTKLILLIHGGGWVSGQKEYVNYYARRFSDFGFAAVSMNYRLASDTVHYQEMLNDIDTMIGCISKNADRWGVGNGQLALFGYSAGGHLALLYSYSRNMDQHVTSVISLAGPTDVQDSLLWEGPGLLDGIKLMTGDTLPANWTLANPVHYISVSNPATLLIHGTNDSVVPVSQSLVLKQALDASDSRVRMLLLENETHYYSSAATEQIMDEAKRFLDANMK
jgi:acetyl esterase/lipase